MSKHRAAVRPRYGRLAALGAALAVTAVAVLGGTGVLSSAAGSGPRPASAAPAALDDAADAASGDAAPSPTDETSPSVSARVSADASDAGSDAQSDTTLPAGSGTGKRIVFSESRQRVWLVSGGHRVDRTYLVSGSLYDNLDPGTYSVYSKSEQAWGIDDSGTMKYFVRFTQGDSAAIGFHDIPVDDGGPVQTVAQLGTPQSHGCIRQKRSDAIALWDFAPVGTKVVVTA
ncbi:L,D-transpeptidase [Nocardioides sp.]|uniref:L,D-transpeptidase n=1 Tax=Nocardioides sp. TaxID=35761 RepID=UPI003784E425